MNETVSILRAKKIVEDVNQFAIKSKDIIIDKSKEYADGVSKIWADNEAVEFFKRFKEGIEGILHNFHESTSTFAKIVEEIHNKYARAGGMPRATFNAVRFDCTVDVSAVKSAFPGENGAFGFKGNPEVILSILDQVSTSIMSDIASLSSNLGNNQAFGNQEVQKNVAEYVEVITNNLASFFDTTKKYIATVVDNASAVYKRTGNEAVAIASQVIPQGETEPQQ